MMSDERFICGLGFPINSDDPIRIISDSVEDKDYYKFSDICNVLNEQQSIIRRDEMSIKTMMSNMKKLEEENEQLRENLHNCRFNKSIIREKLKLWQDVHKEYNIYSIKDFEELLNEQEQKIQLPEKVNEDLREVNKENRLLHEENVKQCERWRNLYELKDSEVTARVDTLNRVCNYYLTETRFKGDTDPNDAVKEVINEILNAPIYEE